MERLLLSKRPFFFSKGPVIRMSAVIWAWQNKQRIENFPIIKSNSLSKIGLEKRSSACREWILSARCSLGRQNDRKTVKDEAGCRVVISDFCPGDRSMRWWEMLIKALWFLVALHDFPQFLPWKSGAGRNASLTKYLWYGKSLCALPELLPLAFLQIPLLSSF